MEQQDSVQSIEERGNYAQETTELSINDVSVPYEFRDGAYYCEGLDGGYISLDTLRRAWVMKVRAEKIKQARQTVRAGRASVQDKKKAIRDFQKWQQTEVK